jgi:hypothetical protein
VRVGAVGVCVCERLKGVRGSASKAWPRRERDIAAMSRGYHARRGRGGGMARLGQPRLGVAGQKQGQARIVSVVRVCDRATPWPPRVAAHRRLGGTAAVLGQGKGSVDGCRIKNTD